MVSFFKTCAFLTIPDYHVPSPFELSPQVKVLQKHHSRGTLHHRGRSQNSHSCFQHFICTMSFIQLWPFIFTVWEPGGERWGESDQHHCNCHAQFLPPTAARCYIVSRHSGMSKCLIIVCVVLWNEALLCCCSQDAFHPLAFIKTAIIQWWVEAPRCNPSLWSGSRDLTRLLPGREQRSMEGPGRVAVLLTCAFACLQAESPQPCPR